MRGLCYFRSVHILRFSSDLMPSHLALSIKRKALHAGSLSAHDAQRREPRRYEPELGLGLASGATAPEIALLVLEQEF